MRSVSSGQQFIHWTADTTIPKTIPLRQATAVLILFYPPPNIKHPVSHTPQPLFVLLFIILRSVNTKCSGFITQSNFKVVGRHQKYESWFLFSINTWKAVTWLQGTSTLCQTSSLATTRLLSQNRMDQISEGINELRFFSSFTSLHQLRMDVTLNSWASKLFMCEEMEMKYPPRRDKRIQRAKSFQILGSIGNPGVCYSVCCWICEKVMA